MKTLVVTMGDPAGCGPFITLKAIDALKHKDIDFIVVGDYAVLRDIPIYKKIKSRFDLIDVNSPGIKKLKKGYISQLAAGASLLYLDTALEIISKQNRKRLVTAPVSKEAIKLLYPEFSGHTEYLAKYFKANKVEMMMVSGKLKVVLFTRHQLLRDVPRLMRESKFKDTISLVHRSLCIMFGLKNPKIALAAFNPHAGIETFMDREERIMHAAGEASKRDVYGPFPADSIFKENCLSKYDCIISPYHDQAMIPFKLLSDTGGVNLTLGLPIIRTSPAHGVAFDVVRRKLVPNHASMVEAIKLAAKLSP